MDKARIQDLIDTLDRLLSEERAALLAGDIEAINRMAAEKETVIDQLTALDDVPHAALETLHHRLRHNQNLMASALEGIRAAAQRMADLRNVRRALHTYDRTGTIHEVTPDPEHRVEKHA